MLNPGLKYHYGIKASFSYKSVIIYSLMWSIQGLYTSSFILAPIKRSTFKLLYARLPVHYINKIVGLVIICITNLTIVIIKSLNLI